MTSLLDITKTTDLPSFTGSSSTEEPAKQSSETVFCSTHQEEPVNLFCETCGEAICFPCAIAGGDHQSHTYVDLSKAYSDHREELDALLKSFRESLEELNGVLGQVDETAGALREKESQLEAEVVGSFKELHSLLNLRQAEVLGALKDSSHGQVKTLASRKDELEVAESKVSRAVDLLSGCLTSGDMAKALKSKKEMEGRLREVSTMLKHSSGFVSTGKLAFHSTEGVAKACREFGGVLLSDGPEPSKCRADIVAGDVRRFQVGMASTVKILMFDGRGQPWESDMTLSCSANLIPEVKNTSCSTVRGSTERTGANEYEMTFTPTSSGSHKLHVAVLDEHIEGSPFQIAVDGPKKVREQRGLDGLSEVVAVAVSPLNDALVVVRGVKPCVVVFNSYGGEICSFGQVGFGRGCLNRPSGVAVSDVGEIAIADTYNNRVAFFSKVGEFLAVVGGRSLAIKMSSPQSKNSISVKFDHPRSVAFNAFNKCWYVLDNGDVYKLRKTRELVATFGQRMVFKKEPLQSPQGLICDDKGNVYVTDAQSNTVRAFTYYGQLLFSLDGKVLSLSEPLGLGWKGGSLFVCGRQSNRVSLYRTAKKSAGFLEEKGTSKPWLFQNPFSVAFDSSGTCYVADKTGIKKCGSQS